MNGRARTAAGHLLRDLRYARRVFRRSPGFPALLIGILALGIGVGGSLLGLVRAGLLRPRLYTNLLAPEWNGGAPRAAIDGALDAPLRTVAEIQDAGLQTLLLLLLGATVLVVALAVINAAALLLARATTRRSEMAVRAAVGATRGRLALQLGVEGAVVGVLGIGSGLLLGGAFLHLLRSTWPNRTPAWGELSIEPWILLAVGSGFGLVALLLPLASVVTGARTNLHKALASGSRSTPGRHEGELRNALAIGEIALSMVLLVGAGLLLQGMLASPPPEVPEVPEDARIGARSVLTLPLDLSTPRYASPEQRAAFYGALLEQVESLPGVKDTSVASPGAWVGMGDEVRVRTVCPPCWRGTMILPVVNGVSRVHAVSPAFFRTLDVTLLAGREFTVDDGLDAPGVAIVSQTFAYHLFPNGEPLGKKLRVGGREDAWYTVVGVVEDIRTRGIGTPSEPVPALYLSALQHPPRVAGLAVETSGSMEQAIPAVLRVIEGLDPGQAETAASEMMTLEEQVARFLAPLRWFARVFGALAAAAILLTGLGLGGVISYNVTRRNREMGIRAALGARPAQVIRMIVKQTLRLVVIGGALGLLGALSIARLLQVLFLGVSPLDATVYGSVALLLGATALLASILPARQAARVDPGIVLQGE